MRISTIVARGSNKIRQSCMIHILPRLNRYFLKGFNVAVGHNCQIAARVVLRISKRARVSIGDNFRLSGYCLTNPLNNRRTCLSVSDNAELRIGNDVGMSSPTLYVQKSLIIGNNVNLGGGTVVLDSDCHSLSYLDRRDGIADQAYKKCEGIVIEDDVLVGAYSIILKGVHIGARSVIGAGSVVTKSIPADCIAAGNPCKVIREIKDT